jgi:prophage antirepressor-like protein
MESTGSNALQVFDFEGKQVRVILRNGEPWWVLKDVCDVLELSNPTVVAERLDDDEKTKVDPKSSLGSRSNEPVTVVNEGGLYNVILRSDKPEAKKFRKWVTSEVLPAIRKTGEYHTSAKNSQNEIALKRADAQLNNSRVRIAKCIRETIKDFVDILSPQSKQAIAAYIADTVTGQPGLIPLPVVEKTYTASELGKQFGISANMIGRIANKHGLKTAEYGLEVLDKAKGHNKQVPSFRYNENGREKLAHIILDCGAPEEGTAD